MSMAAAFAGMAASLSGAMGGPYHPALIHDISAPVMDDGGSIVTPGVSSVRDAMVQVDAATDAMRRAEGFVDSDVRLLVLGLCDDLSTDATVEVLRGPSAGLYSIQSAERDPAGIGWAARGRRV